MFDEDLPRKRPESEFPRKLDNMSVSDLEEYVVELKEEITRVEEEIKKKKASQEAASAFFK